MIKRAVFIVIFLVLGFFQLSAFAQSDDIDAAQSRRRGYELQTKGNYRKALFYYQRALALQPGSAPICNDVALMQEYIGQKKEAEQGYLKAINLDYRYLPPYMNLGVFYSKQGQHMMAVKYLRERVDRGAANDPWTLQAQEELIKAYKNVPLLEGERLRVQADILSEKIVHAKEQMKRSANRNQTLDFEAAYQQGMDAIKESRFADAVELLETAVTLNPRSNGARSALRRAQFGKEKALIDSQAVTMQVDDKNRSISQTLDEISSP